MELFLVDNICCLWASLQTFATSQPPKIVGQPKVCCSYLLFPSTYYSAQKEIKVRVRTKQNKNIIHSKACLFQQCFKQLGLSRNVCGTRHLPWAVSCCSLEVLCFESLEYELVADCPLKIDKCGQTREAVEAQTRKQTSWVSCLNMQCSLLLLT